MQSKAIDPVDFREAQHKHWDSAAVGWKEWSEFNDSADGHISERLVELAEVQSGSRVLDVAAGYGEPALTAARKAGPEGRAGASSSSLTRRPPRGASEASSSRAREWRSARGASPIRSPSSRFR